MSITVHSADDIRCMRVAGRLACEVLDFITPYVKPGITTNELDRLCHEYIVNVQGAIPAPLNYAFPGFTPYPKSICTAVNHVACHGIPGALVLKPGDIINVDVTVIKDGYHGDTSRMFYVGEPSDAARRVCEVALDCMWAGIAQVKPGAHVGDIGWAIQRHAEASGMSLVREVGGHGIGKKFHDDPFIPSYGEPGTLAELASGMIFTVEPIVCAGRGEIATLADGWTMVTMDGGLSAQWEHTVLVTDTGVEILTAPAACIGLSASRVADRIHEPT
jgi:methionyl aminopeptidase